MFRLVLIAACLAALALVGWLDREPLARAFAGDVDALALGVVALKALLACVAAFVLVRMAAGRMRPVTIALVFTVALAGWLASKPLENMLRGGAAGSGPAGQAAVAERATAPVPVAPVLPAVRVRESRAEAVSPELVVNGRTEAARSVVLRAETSGRVTATPVAKGALVEAGAVLVRLDEADRAAKVRQGEARVAQRQLEYDAARRLGERQFQSETRVAEARAELEESRADLEEARLDLARIEVKAPFKGVLERRPVEVGDYVAPGGEVAHFVEQDPFLVAGDAPETLAGRFRVGEPGAAALVDGTTVEGRVRYVAGQADEGTRTFRVELEVPNPSGRFQAGMSARLVVREPPIPAHRISAAALVLDDVGKVGVKAVGEGDVVRFHEARIVKAEAEALWLAGLPETLRIITTGQGFVQDGQKVAAQVEPADSAAAATTTTTGAARTGT